MWIKTLLTVFKKKKITVAAFVETRDDDKNNEGRDFHVVKIKSMWEEWFLEEEVRFNSLLEAQAFVTHFTKEMALSFLERQWAANGI